MVRVADHAVGRGGDVLVTLGLGSCVAILLHDPEVTVGGMAHVLLPDPSSSRNPTNRAKFATTAVSLLLEEMAGLGGDPGRAEARLVGGASMFASLKTATTMNTGERNLEAARGALQLAGVPLVGEAVGEDYGRSVRFRIKDGKTTVTSVMRDDIVL